MLLAGAVLPIGKRTVSEAFSEFSWSTWCFGKNKQQEEERQRTDLETVTLHWQERLREYRGKDAQCVLVLHGKWLAQAQAMELEKDYCTLWTMDLKRKRKLDYAWVWMISHEKLRSCEYSQTNNWCISAVDILKYHTSVKYFNATLITACKGVKLHLEYFINTQGFKMVNCT